MFNIKFKVGVLLSAVVVSLSNCTYDVYNPDVCFQENVLPVFVSNCTMSKCHNATDREAGYDLSTYEGIMKGVTPKHPLRSSVYTTINGINPSMPPRGYPKLSAKDISYIKIWIRMGAENTANCGGGCDTINYTYNNRIKPFLTTWCVGCHSTANPGGGYDLSTYTGVVAAITNNRLMGTLQQAAGFSPMPKNAAKLSDCDINAVQKWITAGYLNN